MLSFVVLCFLYGLPVGGCVLLLRMILISVKSRRIANRVTGIIAVVFFLSVTAVAISDYYSRKHSFGFHFNSARIEVSALEEDTFMDWPVQFEVTVFNAAGKELKRLQFITTEGPYVRFRSSPAHPDMLLIEGEKGNHGLLGSVDLGKENHGKEGPDVSVNGYFHAVENKHQTSLMEKTE